MRVKITVALVLLALLPACGGAAGSGGGIPTLVPTSDPSAPNADSPRPGVVTFPGGLLPPTFTPAPEPAPPTEAPTATAEPTREPGGTHVVQAGDTLAEIAEQYGVTLDELAVANDIVEVDVIEVGQVLVIP